MLLGALRFTFRPLPERSEADATESGVDIAPVSLQPKCWSHIHGWRSQALLTSSCQRRSKS